MENPIPKRSNSRAYREAIKVIFLGGKPYSNTDEEIRNALGYYVNYALRDLNALAKSRTPDNFFPLLEYTINRLGDFKTVSDGGFQIPEIYKNETFKLLAVDKGLVIDEFITRSYDYAYRKAQKFKSKDGRNNYIKRFFKSLEEYEKQMCPDNLARLSALKMVAEVYGVEPSPNLNRKKKKS